MIDISVIRKVVRIFIALMMLITQSCGYSEYEPQVAKSIIINPDRAEHAIRIIRKFAKKNGFLSQLERRDILKNNQKHFSIIYKKESSFINIKNISYRNCIDISLYLKDESNNVLSELKSIMDTLDEYLIENSGDIFLSRLSEQSCKTQKTKKSK
ncbi:hypothetical protein [Aliikangiella sp. IMCC44359]|uniref:hypothetical protein n=1 Tax=Aliikangiella sp. IMCC44359 TaxID=3459125 RepID=UPI00403AFC8E